MWRNAKREKIWDAMSEREKSVYLATTGDKGNKRYFLRCLPSAKFWRGRVHLKMLIREGLILGLYIKESC